MSRRIFKVTAHFERYIDAQNEAQAKAELAEIIREDADYTDCAAELIEDGDTEGYDVHTANIIVDRKLCIRYYCIRLVQYYLFLFGAEILMK